MSVADFAFPSFFFCFSFYCSIIFSFTNEKDLPSPWDRIR